VGAALLHSETQTDRHDEGNRVFLLMQRRLKTEPHDSHDTSHPIFLISLLMLSLSSQISRYRVAEINKHLQGKTRWAGPYKRPI
jgi:hypothetical protein